MKFYLTFPGDANNTWVFGGAPHDLKNALRENGEDAACLDLSPGRMHALKRYAWNLKEAALFRGIGGYQYSDTYLNDIWRGTVDALEPGTVINFFPLFNDAAFRRRDLRKIFYMDQTNAQLYDTYHLTNYVSHYHRAATIAKEKRNYEEADFVVCMCQWAADSMVRDYGISSDRIGVVLPGGSLDYRVIPGTREVADLRAFDASRPLRFVFVGLDPVRKGLFRFLDALKTIPELRKFLRLTVVGPVTEMPPQYRDLECIRWLGRIERKDFLETVSAHDVGILLSIGEATGRSLREFQMLGLAVIAPNVGGSPEMVAPGAGLFIEKDDGPDEIAAVIRRLLENPTEVARMRDTAWEARYDMTWNATADRMIALLRERGLA